LTVSRPPCHQLFYAEPDHIESGLIHFSREETSHMVSSLRLKAGESITATDGRGRLIEAELREAERGRAVAEVLCVEEVPPPDVMLTLYQGLIRPQRMDLIVEKCVELGINRLVPLVSERALERGTEARLKRWRKIAIEAMKQSLRPHLPAIEPATAFGDALRDVAGLDLALVAHQEEEGGAGLEAADVRIGKGTIGLFIGPEGGFSDAEIRVLAERGARLFGMGGARLKSETAAIAAVAIIRRLLD
jgi:16S rRNA (uracil1498-N3)-methyltransferase